MEQRLRQALVAAWQECPEEYRHAPATEAELQAFEAEFGPIPAAYREYLMVCGGIVGGSPERLDGVAELRDSHRTFAAQSGSGGWTMRGVFIIGWDGGGNPFGIDRESGRVLVEDHDFGGIHEMAPSFFTMLSRGLRLEGE